jgi:alkyl sulfatase BDS1-like metallo-beta-lactamase superfamily hydrolase
MGPDSLVLALKSTFDPASAIGLDAVYELILDDLPYRIEVSNGRFQANRGEADRPDATIRTDPGTMTELVFRGRSLTDALRARDIEIEGNKQAATRLVRLLAHS